VLVDHREELDILAKALLDKETLSGEDMRELLVPTTISAQL